MQLATTIQRVAAVTAALALAACASGYAQFYKPAPGATPEEVAIRRAAPPTGNPLVERVAPPAGGAQPLMDAYAKRGFVMIGSSSFNSGQAESENAAVEQGRKVGADLVVIMNPRYTGSTTTSVPITTPATSTSYTNSSATAYGSAGTVNAYGNSTTTTYGTQTNYVPITVNRVDYSAGYFIKQRWIIGAMWRDLNDAERQELQSNKGVVVRLVVDGQPAYHADILPGDIILAVNGEPVAGQEGITKISRANSGRKVMFSIYRRGQRLEKPVQLN
jgi:hypothetical protein